MRGRASSSRLVVGVCHFLVLVLTLPLVLTSTAVGRWTIPIETPCARARVCVRVCARARTDGSGGDSHRGVSALASEGGDGVDIF